MLSRSISFAATATAVMSKKCMPHMMQLPASYKINHNITKILTASFTNSSTTANNQLQSAEFHPKKTKHRPPQKKASKLLNQIKKEQLEKLKNGRDFPDFVAGDSIQIEKLPYMSATEPDIIKGLVIAKSKKGSDSTVLLSNVEYGTPVHRQLKIYSPLIQNIKILQRAFIHKGKKRVRRSKIYYIIDRHPSNYTVK